jgi:hypothetical protein
MHLYTFFPFITQNFFSVYFRLQILLALYLTCSGDQDWLAVEDFWYTNMRGVLNNKSLSAVLQGTFTNELIPDTVHLTLDTNAVHYNYTCLHI